MRGNKPDQLPPVDRIFKALELFEERAEGSCLPDEITTNLVVLANRAQVAIKAGQLDRADDALSGALLCIQRNLGSEISLHLGFDLATLLLEEAKRYTAHPASLYQDVTEFAEVFLDRLPDANPYVGAPAFLYQRPPPQEFAPAFQQFRDLLDENNVPENAAEGVLTELDALEALSAAIVDGRPTAEQSRQCIQLVGGLAAGLVDLEGVYLTRSQVHGALATILLAWPAWACWNPWAVLVQAIIILLVYLWSKGGSVGGSKATQKVSINIWTYLMDCTKSISEVLGEVGRQVSGKTKDELKTIKRQLQVAKKELLKGKKIYTGNKGKVLRKLNAAIADVQRTIVAMP